MKFLIPSYKRADTITTVDTLLRFGVPGSDIHVGVQSENDREQYEMTVGDRAKVLYREAHNCAGNRNNLLSILNDGEYAVLMDDDVKDILRYQPKGKGKYGEFVSTDVDGFWTFLETALKTMEMTGVKLAGPQTGTNAMYASAALRRKKPFLRNKIVNGGCMFVMMSATTRYDDTYDCYDDIEASLHEIRNNAGTLVFYTYCVKKVGDQRGKGGCQEVYANGGQKKALARLEKEYYPMARHNKDWTTMIVTPNLK